MTSSGFCLDCSKPAVPVNGGRFDYYMVKDSVWCRAFGLPVQMESSPDYPKGLLCLSCLSSRLGRPLFYEDFRSGVPLNEGAFGFYRAAFPRRKP